MMIRPRYRWSVALLVCVIGSLLPVAPGALPKEWQDQIDASRGDVEKIRNYILRGEGRHKTFDRLALLGDTFGHRLSGSETLENAIDYAIANMTARNFSYVHKEEVSVPKWTRGDEWGWIETEHYSRRLDIMALGTSIGTNGTNLTAPIVVVRSFKELNDTHANNPVAGKIVVFNQPWQNYGQSGQYRREGAARAAEKGAVAVLIRSVASRSIYSPHTGVQNYEAGIQEIPAASITVEDAEMLQRMYDRGQTFKVTIYMEAENHPNVTSYNAVGQINGTDFPDETVIFGGHIDTWDVTDGSMDDGGGVMMAWEAINVIHDLGLKPKRTIRLVLWTAEEFGLYGGIEYHRANRHEVNQTALIMQADGGSFRPHGLKFTGSGLARSILEEILKPLDEINATTVQNGGGASSDTGNWVADGVPGAELLNANENYFDFHHTRGDAMTALDALELDHCTAVWATVAYAVASLDQLLPREGDYIAPDTTSATPPLHGTTFTLGAGVASSSIVLTLLAALLSFIGILS